MVVATNVALPAQAETCIEGARVNWQFLEMTFSAKRHRKETGGAPKAAQKRQLKV